MITRDNIRRDIRFVEELCAKAGIAKRDFTCAKGPILLRSGFEDAKGSYKRGVRFNHKPRMIVPSRAFTQDEQSKLFDAWRDNDPAPSGKLWYVGKGTGRRYPRPTSSGAFLIYKPEAS